MATAPLEDVLGQERAVWEALVAGDAAADAALLAEEFLGVYPSGFAGRDEHGGQLRDGPTVASYELSAARLVQLSADVVLLAYRADYVPCRGEGAGEPRAMFVTSVWRREGAGWCNVFSQDTPADG